MILVSFAHHAACFVRTPHLLDHFVDCLRCVLLITAALRPSEERGKLRTHFGGYGSVQPQSASLLSPHLVQPLLQVCEFRETLVVVKFVLEVVAVLVHDRPRAALFGVAIRADALSLRSGGETPRRELVSLDLKEARVDVPQEREEPALGRQRWRAFVAAPHSQHGLLEGRRPVLFRAIAERRLFVHRVDASLPVHAPKERRHGCRQTLMHKI